MIERKVHGIIKLVDESKIEYDFSDISSQLISATSVPEGFDTPSVLTIVLGSLRTGKTTALKALEESLKRTSEMHVVYIDLWKYRNLHIRSNLEPRKRIVDIINIELKHNDLSLDDNNLFIILDEWGEDDDDHYKGLADYIRYFPRKKSQMVIATQSIKNIPSFMSDFISSLFQLTRPIHEEDKKKYDAQLLANKRNDEKRRDEPRFNMVRFKHKEDTDFINQEFSKLGNTRQEQLLKAAQLVASSTVDPNGNVEILLQAPSRKGKSLFIEHYAITNGVSVEEAKSRFESTKEYTDKLSQKTSKNDDKNEMVTYTIHAYWENSDKSEFNKIHDAVIDILDIDINEKQIKKILESLPSHIITSGMYWGFRDTVIGDEIYSYIEENTDLIVKAIESVS